jgi:hypothetical protein
VQNASSLTARIAGKRTCVRTAGNRKKMKEFHYNKALNRMTETIQKREQPHISSSGEMFPPCRLPYIYNLSQQKTGLNTRFVHVHVHPHPQKAEAAHRP